MSFTYRHRKELIILLFIVIVTGITTFALLNTKTKVISKKPKNKILTLKKEVKKEDILKELKVDVKGYVNNPGLYTLNENERVEDAINKAGGLKEGASTEVINLSKKLKDEMVIIIYSIDEVNNFVKTKELEKEKINSCINNVEEVVNNACIEIKDENNKLININTASLEDLIKIDGIGESKAEAIIKYRNEHLFTNLEELKNINGIGESTYNKIKESLTI